MTLMPQNCCINIRIPEATAARLQRKRRSAKSLLRMECGAPVSCDGEELDERVPTGGDGSLLFE